MLNIYHLFRFKITPALRATCCTRHLHQSSPASHPSRPGSWCRQLSRSSMALGDREPRRRAVYELQPQLRPTAASGRSGPVLAGSAPAAPQRWPAPAALHPATRIIGSITMEACRPVTCSLQAHRARHGPDHVFATPASGVDVFARFEQPAHVPRLEGHQLCTTPLYRRTSHSTRVLSRQALLSAHVKKHAHK